jgi:glycosyltransferase involved in cell wall biosynthesis
MAAPPVNQPEALQRAADDRRAGPLVTVGLPVYNGSRFLARAMDSLLAQHWTSLELVVSDNASTDGSAEIAERYAARDPRVRVVRSAVNAGVEANFARVLAEASGTYFMWAACDDWWAPGFVDAMVSALESNPQAVVAMSAVERTDEGGRTLDTVRFTGRSDPSGLTPWRLSMALAGGRPYHLYIYGLHRTEFLKRLFTGFPSVIAADRLFILRLAMAGRFAYVDQVLLRRTMRQVPLAQRYADEAIGRLWRGAVPRWRLALYAGPYLWRSPGLSAARRLWIPALVLRFAWASAGHTIAQARRLGRAAMNGRPAC